MNNDIMNNDIMNNDILCNVTTSVEKTFEKLMDEAKERGLRLHKNISKTHYTDEELDETLISLNFMYHATSDVFTRSGLLGTINSLSIMRRARLTVKETKTGLQEST